MERLKLMALDAEDLAVVSAYCQDAVLKAGDIDYFPAENRLVMAMNRFAWERASQRGRSYERRRAALHFARVSRVRTLGFDPHDGDLVLSLLAITFTPGEAPAGTIELVFAGGAGMRLEVECIEVQLTDMAAAWQAGSKPDHRV